MQRAEALAATPRAVRTLTDVAPGGVRPGELIANGQPTLLRGVARDWLLVAAGRRSADEAMRYLLQFDAGHRVLALVGEPAIRGRFHYDASATRMNFTSERLPLADALERIAAEDGRAFYIGSTDIDTYLPGLRAENDLVPADDVFAQHPPVASIWIGNRTIASAHYDMSNNAAVCAVGRRRFTLFPPDQVANLYPGPLEPTPGGQVVSMVDFVAPDLDRFPRFAEALAHAQVAELEAGDLLVYPALWWHHVEALDLFNVLVNYWWNDVPGHLDDPQTTLLHAMLSLRERPAAEKAAWRALFDYYVFGDAERPVAHLPDGARGPLAPLDAAAARRLRAYLLNRLNR